MSESVVGALQRRLSEIRPLRNEAKARYEELEAVCQAMEIAIAEMQQPLVASTVGQITLMVDGSVNGKAERQSSETYTDHDDETISQGANGAGKELRLVGPVDFTGRKTASERLVAIAEATADGIVTTMGARGVFLDAGVSRAKPRNLLNDIQRRLRRHDDFRHVGRGEYQYAPMADAETAD